MIALAPRAALALSAVLVLAACAEDSATTCDGEIADATDRYGVPDRVRETMNDDFSITTVSWPGRVLSFFGSSDGCDVTVSTF